MDLTKLLTMLEGKNQHHWQRYLYDSLLAPGSILLLTGIIFLFHLYIRIFDSFLVYLLIILILASVRGLYAALVASVLAFLFFDFLFVPPVYSLSVSKFEDFLTLIVFLVTALITGQLASALRKRAADASQREREARILYEVVRAANHEKDMQRQLAIFANALVEVFSASGILHCLFLLPDSANRLLPQQADNPIELLEEEEIMARWALEQGQTLDVRQDITQLQSEMSKALPAEKVGRKLIRSYYLRFVPLKTDQKVIGVLRLLILHNPRRQMPANDLGIEQEQSTSLEVFFSTFLEQAVAIIERERLRCESMHIQLLEQKDALRSALLSSVSHDLRTPLSTIKTAATSLLKKDIKWDEDARDSFAAAIERESDRLNSLVENLLDMSRIEAGSLHPEKVWYPLDVLIRDVLTRMHTQLQKRIVQTDIPAELPPVELDYVQIDQVLTNLIENAIHYTPDSTPLEITVHVQERYMSVCIIDHGPGVAPDEQERIFDKFYRVLENGRSSTANSGSGLGLAICKSLIEAHGGRIWVEPGGDEGAVFQFTLPLGDWKEHNDE